MHWRDKTLVVFCAPEHPLAHKRRVTVADLAAQRWCLQHRFADTRRQFTLEVLKRARTIHIVLESDSIPVLIGAVKANVGLGCLPRPCIARELAAGELCELRVDELDLLVPFNIVTHKQVTRTEAQERFIAMLRAGTGEAAGALGRRRRGRRAAAPRGGGEASGHDGRRGATMGISAPRGRWLGAA
jgi:DNA-binding transcriptional LysR family regulator